MARRRVPENETVEQATVRKNLQLVADHAPRGEKVSFERKMVRLQGLVEQVRPIEDQISDLLVQKAPLIDQIAELRAEMVHECIHPFASLVDRGTHIHCSFCDRKLIPTKYVAQDTNGS